ncbi:hypothetical protein APA386B_466 [Acetobacter pasteurianus 386B]|nr:hypothetical protein APA386B_466 [Acetobacter pasteurianus 386B]
MPDVALLHPAFLGAQWSAAHEAEIFFWKTKFPKFQKLFCK